MKTREVYRDRLVGVVRKGHSLGKRLMTADRYAASSHVLVALRENRGGPVDAALELLGLQRSIAVTVTGYSAAIGLARSTNLVATVPELSTRALTEGLHVFALPFETPVVPISLHWHPRIDADPAHRWLRRCVQEVLAATAAAK